MKIDIPDMTAPIMTRPSVTKHCCVVPLLLHTGNPRAAFLVHEGRQAAGCRDAGATEEGWCLACDATRPDTCAISYIQ